MKREPVHFHPGVILNEEFMQPTGLSANALARAIRVPASRISNIIRGRTGITADTAIRLGLYFDNCAEFWMILQSNYELSRARQKHGTPARGHGKKQELEAHEHKSR